MNKIELLIPCGSKEAFYAAVHNGADAVYLGGKTLNARAFADNFDHDDLIEVIRYAHLHGVRVYVTMNTMITEDEMTMAIKEAKFLYQNGVDALIVQDLGFIAECSHRFPNLELHASTQMNINNYQAAAFAYSMGIKRIVLARESSLETIAAIAKDFEVEVFAHGALCVSYSGQCLMSSSLFGRSGNRGTCAQCCRLQYQLYDEDQKSVIKLDDEYLLSPKDLNTLDHVGDFIRANVASLKIEGRMKRSEYVALVTRLYRMAIDAYYRNEAFVVSAQMIKDLKLMFNRGFTCGYAFNAASKDLFNPYRPNHIGVAIGEVIGYRQGRIKIRLNDDLSQTDGLRIIDDKKEFGIVANKIYLNNLLTSQAQNGDVIELNYDHFIHKGAKLYKTTDTKLLTKIDRFAPYRRVEIDCRFKAKIGHHFELWASDGFHDVHYISELILPGAAKIHFSLDDLLARLRKTNDTAFVIKEVKGDYDDVFIPVKVINEARRTILEQLANKRMDYLGAKPVNDTPLSLNQIEFSEFGDIVEVSDEDQYFYLKDRFKVVTANAELAKKHHIAFISPNVNEKSQSELKPFIATELGCLRACNFVSYHFNIANSSAVACLYRLGVQGAILSSELSEYQIKRIIESFERRFGFKPLLYYLAYGRRDLMFIKNPLVYPSLATGIDPKHSFALIDRKQNYFRITKDDNGLTHLLEHKPMINDFNLPINRYYRFTVESKAMIKEVLK